MTMKLDIIGSKSRQLTSMEIDEYIIYTDKFGRKWKLKPVTNPAILMPFIIEPLPILTP